MLQSKQSVANRPLEAMAKGVLLHQ